MEHPDSPSVRPEGKEKAKNEIEQMKEVVENATVEEVDAPSGRKDVEVAYTDEEGEFHVEEGTAIGVYREQKTVFHIDWADERGRTTVTEDELESLEEGDWFFEDE